MKKGMISLKHLHFFAAVVTVGMMCLSTFSVQGYAGTDNSKDVVETVIGLSLIHI